MRKLKKLICEIDGCGVTDPAQLHKHHIIPKTDVNCSNHEFNLAILCANHHEMLHDNKRLKIIGIYPSTRLPYGRTLVYELNGICNVPEIKEVYFKNKPKQSVIFNKEEK